MDQRLSKNDLSLNVTSERRLGRHATRFSSGPGTRAWRTCWLTTRSRVLIRNNLKSLEPRLNEKERDILHERLLSDSPVTLREIGERFNVTRERVRQIEARLLQKIKDHLSERLQDFSKDWIRNHE